MISRRTFLQRGSGATVVGCLQLSVLGACRRVQPLPVAPVLLSFAEQSTTAAACERILPRDEDPGAIDLGVPAFIDRTLYAEPRWRRPFRAGLRALDEESRRRSGAPFASAAAITQDNILDDWQEGSREQAEFVRLLLRLTLEGAFGDPSHGGNRAGLGWRLVGFEPCEPRAHHPA